MNLVPHTNGREGDPVQLEEQHILRHGPRKEPDVSGIIRKKICEMVDNSSSSWSLESKTLKKKWRWNRRTCPEPCL